MLLKMLDEMRRQRMIWRGCGAFRRNLRLGFTVNARNIITVN